MCDAGVSLSFEEIKETATCEYVAVVHTNLLCRDAGAAAAGCGHWAESQRTHRLSPAAFAVAEETVHAIKCFAR